MSGGMTFNSADIMPITEQQFYDRIRESDREMAKGFAALMSRFEDHAREDQSFYDRVLRIEVQREEEKRQALTRGALAGAVAGSVPWLYQFGRWIFRL